MVHWIEPHFSKNRVKRAGKNIKIGIADVNDLEVFENWRASHAYILNTFQSNLRNRSRNQEITVAQRLKRKNTIYDKLKRESAMQLSTMQDIAGCRVIFPLESSLRDFRDSLHQSRMKHVLKNHKDRYDYIINPKESGYRGIHDVYEYRVSSLGGVRWNGLLIEIQYRTKIQHAWATAVEVADIINTSRVKFGEANVALYNFFRLASEILARSHEGRSGCVADVSDKKLIEDFRRIDRGLRLLRSFENLRKSESRVKFRQNLLLIFRGDVPEEEDSLEIETFDSINKAIERYGVLEKKFGDTADIVLVRAATPESIRDAFRNYFSDAHDFVQYIRTGIENLE